MGTTHDETIMATKETEPVVSGVGLRTRATLADEDDDRPTREALFEALSNERRRCALYYLQQQEGPVSLGEVVDYVAAWQYDQPISELDSDDRMCVYSALHQAHLPKLDAAGFIDYDSESGEIRARDEVEYARLYLEYDPGNDISWSTFYAGLVGVGVLLGGLSQLSVYPFDWLASEILVWMVLLVLAVAACAHVAHEWRNKRAMAEIFDIQQ